MSNFKIGEKVVCVKSNEFVKQGNIYTVVFQHTFKCGTTLVSTEAHPLCDITALRCHCGCGELIHIESPITSGAFRFRKLDHDFAENLLKEISEAMKSETILN